MFQDFLQSQDTARGVTLANTCEVGNRTYVKHEPRTRGTEKNLAILPLTIVPEEVFETSLGDNQVLGLLETLSASELVGFTLVLADHVSLDIVMRLLNITGHIECVSGSFWDGETVVESNACGNSAESDENSPHFVSGQSAGSGTCCDSRGHGERLLESSDHDEGDDSAEQLTETLHGKHGSHHCASPFRSGELRSNDGRQRIVTTNTFQTS
jgi:hypothetical protein